MFSVSGNTVGVRPDVLETEAGYVSLQASKLKSTPRAMHFLYVCLHLWCFSTGVIPSAAIS